LYIYFLHIYWSTWWHLHNSIIFIICEHYSCFVIVKSWPSFKNPQIYIINIAAARVAAPAAETKVSLAINMSALRISPKKYQKVQKVLIIQYYFT